MVLTFWTNIGIPNFKTAYTGWGLIIRTPYNQVDLVIRTGLSPYNQTLTDLVIRTAAKIIVRITRSVRLKLVQFDENWL